MSMRDYKKNVARTDVKVNDGNWHSLQVIFCNSSSSPPPFLVPKPLPYTKYKTGQRLHQNTKFSDNVL